MDTRCMFLIFLFSCKNVNGGFDKTVPWAHFKQPPIDCIGENIDLLLLADASGMIKSATNTIYYQNQMAMFSQLVNNLVPPTETNMTRLKVSLVSMTMDNKTSSLRLEVRIPFNSYDNKTNLLHAIRDEKIPDFHNPLHVYGTTSSLRDIFDGTFYGGRTGARHVVVMATGGQLPPNRFMSSSDLQFLDGHSENVVGLNNTSIIISEDQLSVSQMVKELGSANMIMSPINNPNLVKTILAYLCGQCYQGWFGLRGQNVEMSLTCYKITSVDESLSWLDARDKCGEMNSELVSIETRQELNQLRQVVGNEVRELIKSTNSTTSQTVSLYMGLRRSESSIAHRFEWITKRPLVYTHWGKSQPKGGQTRKCAVWDFLLSDRYLGENSFINKTLSQDKAMDFWSTVGCGQAKSQFYLCESVNYMLGWFGLFNKTIVFHLEPPSTESILKASQKGELFYDPENKMFMSVSDVLHSDEHRDRFHQIQLHSRNQNISFDNLELFSCDADSDAGKLIPYSLVCDFENHCDNHFDEYKCRTCDQQAEFTCTSTQCVSAEATCDLHNDCVDGSDEMLCSDCRLTTCPSGMCLPKHWFGDGEVDCDLCETHEDVDLEMAYAEDLNISQCVFTCNGNQCIYPSMLNDGVVDCKGLEGPMDETIGKLNSTLCYPASENVRQYTNWAPKCVYVKGFYDDVLGCRDMSHLEGCEDFECPEGYVKCSNSYCIPSHYVMNKINDCVTDEDENLLSIISSSCPYYFWCTAGPPCLHPDLVCDGTPHCVDGHDELNCEVTCKPGFVCLAGVVKLHDYDTSIPITDLTFVDRRARFIDLSHADLSAVFPSLPGDHFKNTIYLKLSGCNIKSVHAPWGSCLDLMMVKKLDLGHNFIQSVPSESIFRCMDKLTHLNLSHNTQLSFIDDDALVSYLHSSTLEELDISYTNISALNAETLRNLVALEKLVLKNTPIVKLIFPPNFRLKDLDVRDTKFGLSVTSGMMKNVTVTRNLYTYSFKLCCPQIHNPDTKVSVVCHSSLDPFSSCFDLLSNSALRVFLWTQGLLALSGNLGVIIYRLSCGRQVFQMAYGHFAFHLAISDFLMGVYLLTIAIADTYLRGVYVLAEDTWRCSHVCKIAGFLSTLSTEVSTMFIFLITVDRFLVIRFPFGKFKISGKKVYVCCILAWTIGILIASLPFMPFSQNWYVYNSNGMCLALPLTKKRFNGWEYTTFIFIVFNFILFLDIAWGQWAIYKAMSSMRIKETCLTNARSRRVQDMTVARNLSFVAITNFLCWSPVGIMGLVALAGLDLGKDVFAWIAVTILPLNSGINPLIYTFPTVWRKLHWLKDKWFSREKGQGDDS